jgi:hypothetical protein
VRLRFHQSEARQLRLWQADEEGRLTSAARSHPHPRAIHFSENVRSFDSAFFSQHLVLKFLVAKV